MNGEIHSSLSVWNSSSELGVPSDMIGDSLGSVGLSSSIGLKLSGGVCVGGMIGSGASGVIGASVGPDGITVSGWLGSLRVKKEPAF